MKNKKQILVLLWIVLLILPAVNARTITSTEYMHSNDYYSVVYDGEGDAIVAAKLIIRNDKSDSINEITLELPYQNMIIYNLVQETMERYSYDEMSYKYYDNDIFYPIEHDTEETSTSTILKLYLPRAIEPQKEGAILILYKIPGDTGTGLLGIQNFEFKTIIDKNAALIQNIRVVINVQEGLYLKGGAGKIDYRPDYFNEIQTMSVAKEGMQSAQLSRVSQRITYADGLVKNAYNLDPFESFHVKGEFANALWKLYIWTIVGWGEGMSKNVVSQWKLYIWTIVGVVIAIILGIILLKRIVWKKIKVIFMEFKQKQTEQQDGMGAGYGASIIRSFVFGFLSALMTTVAWTIIKFFGEWLSREFYSYGDLVMPLFILTGIVAVFISFFGLSIYAGKRYGFIEGGLTIIMTVVWLFILLVAMVFLLGIFSRSTYVPPIIY